MTSRSNYSGWSSIIQSVKTPLGFFTLVSLIIDGGTFAAAAATDKIPLWFPAALFAFIVLCVFAIVWKKPYALYHPSEWQNVTVNLVFPIQAIEVDLDVAQCVFEVRDKEGNAKHRGTPNLIFGHGGWAFQITENAGPSDSIRLELVERNGRRWRVNPFAPFETEQRAFETTQI